MKKNENEHERTALLPTSKGHESKSDSPKLKSKALLGTVAFSFLVLALLGAVSISDHDAKPPSASLASTSDSISETNEGVVGSLHAEINVRNEISTNEDMLKTRQSYPDLELGIIVEPQRTTTFTITFDEQSLSMIADSDPVTCTYSIRSSIFGTSLETPWDAINGVTAQRLYHENGSLRAFGSQASSIASSLSFEATIPSPGDYELLVSCPSTETKEDISMSAALSCFYIRRELRDISPQMRDEFLDTFLLMMNDKTKVGQEKFGPNYKDLEYFTLAHLRGAGELRLDHLHEGMGLVTQHMALTAEFERSMQSVIPSIAVPYWDYTYDSYMAEKTGQRPEEWADIFKDSELFTSEWFGKTDEKDHRIADGRFANQEIERNYSSDIHSPYGFLRAPWNINPSKYVSRYHQFCGAKGTGEFLWPTCGSHFQMTNSDEYATWSAWVYHIGFQPHGPVHAWIGGVGGQCESGLWDEMKEKGLITAKQLHQMKLYAFVILKELYRSEKLLFKNDCAPDLPVSECMWTCVENFADDATVQSKISEIWGIESSHDNYKEIVTKALCETPYWPGDHLEAASAAEASFWPIHPTLDRLAQYKSMVRPWKTFDWVDQTMCARSSETDCKGHNPWDSTYFQVTARSGMKERTAYGTKYMSNFEAFRAVTPQEGIYKMPYLYNHFEWAHCSEIGWDFKKVYD